MMQHNYLFGCFQVLIFGQMETTGKISTETEYN